MKRRFANRVNGDYYQTKLDSDYFKGYITYTKLKDIESPVIVNNGLYDFCIINNDYKWIGLYPDDGNYAVTIMFDEKGNLIQWYFDIAKEIGIKNGIPYEDDLYLDMIITKEGKKIIADENELLEAEKENIITHNDVENAYKTLKYIEEKYANNLDKLKEFTNYLLDKFSKNIKERII